MVNIIIFSRNRACQLDLLLRSVYYNFVNWNSYKWNVLYTYDDAFKTGYDLVIKAHPDINFIKETNFKQNVLNLINNTDPYIMFGVDDNVFKNRFDITGSSEFYDFDIRDDVMALSLRMWPGITYCYTENRPTPPPIFKENGINIWNWRDSKLSGDWSYPFSIDMSIFKKKDILENLINVNYWNPNTMEGYLANQAWNKPYLICYKESIIFNNPINKVQTANGNRCGNVSTQYLNKMFLAGDVIDLIPLQGLKNTAPHQEELVTFIKG